MRSMSVSRLLSVAVRVLSLAALLGAAPAADLPPFVPDPTPLLIRDAGVRRELRLSDAQQQGVERVLEEWNERLFRLRMLSPEQHRTQIDEINSGFGRELAALLDDTQKARLEGLRLQATGWQSLLRAEVAARLSLSDSQQQKIAQALENSRRQLGELQSSAKSAKSAKPSELQRKVQKVRTSEHDQITPVLTERQKQTWLELVGPKYDLTKVRQVYAKAPELRSVTEWINSEPLSLRELRGRVVALHFFACDCGNCVHNYPHYEKWHEQLTPRGVVVLGIQTPETKSERDIGHVRQKMSAHDLRYPVAIDNDLANWDAWTNRMWPSTYLIDKQGNIRYLWYGELQWNGADGEKWMREKIDELLAEKDGANTQAAVKRR